MGRFFGITMNSEEHRDSNRPLLIIAMGVAGSGKSTMTRALAREYNLCELDADDFHSVEARAHMAGGKPLNDVMRAPWIQSICDHLRTLAADGRNSVLAFSGLKKAYREPLRHTGFNTVFLFLDGDKETILARMQARLDHFMPPTLIDSQFATLERPTDESDVFALDVRQSLPEVMAQAQAVLQECRPTLQPASAAV